MGSIEPGRTAVPRVVTFVGVLAILAGLAVYSYELAIAVPTPESVAGLVSFAEAYLILLLLGIAVVGLGVRLGIGERVSAIKAKGLAPLSPGWVIPYVLSQRRYLYVFFGSALVYGLFYAFLTSMVVYQPGVDFSSAYGAAIPSLLVTPIRGALFSTPVVTVYLTDHLGLLLIPLTIILAAAITALVGVNVAVATFAVDNRARGGSRSWVAGLGAVVGLFTGCPTCAGLFFANVIGGAGAVSFATLLGYYQPAFILLSLPVLVLTPYLTSRSLSKVFRDGCVYLDWKASQIT